MSKRLIRRWGALARAGLMAAGLCMAGGAPAQYRVDPAQWQVYLKQAESGDAMAQLRMGFLYEKGLGVGQDWSKACRWYRAAAEQNESQGQADYGRCLDRGWGGTPVDSEAAVAWWTRSAAAGNPSAHQALGLALAQGRGVAADPAAAAAHLRFAALAGLQLGGLDVAQGVLGILLAEGKGVAQDRAQARYWLRQSAQSQNGGAARYLEQMGPPTQAEAAAERTYAAQAAQERAAAMGQARLQAAKTVCANDDRQCWVRQSNAVREINAEKLAQREQERAAAAAAQAAQERERREAAAAEAERAYQAQKAAQEKQAQAAREEAIARGAFHLFGFAVGTKLEHYMKSCMEAPDAAACWTNEGNNLYEVSFSRDARPPYLFDLDPDRYEPGYTAAKTCLLEDGWMEVSCFGGELVPPKYGYKTVVQVGLIDEVTEHVRFSFAWTPAYLAQMEGLATKHLGPSIQKYEENGFAKRRWSKGKVRVIIACRDRKPSHCYFDLATTAWLDSRNR